MSSHARLLSAVVLALFVFLAVPAHATTVTVTYPGTPINPFGVMSFVSHDLDGITFSGQPLSLDIRFANNYLIKVQSPNFFIGLGIDTNGGVLPHFPGPTTGYLIDQFGHALPTQNTGGAISSDGGIDFGLFFFSPPGATTEFLGAHFDISALPTDGFTITQTRVGTGGPGVYFGTPEMLPESESVLAFLLVGLVGVLAMRFRSLLVWRTQLVGFLSVAESVTISHHKTNARISILPRQRQRQR